MTLALPRSLSGTSNDELQGLSANMLCILRARVVNQLTDDMYLTAKVPMVSMVAPGP